MVGPLMGRLTDEILERWAADPNHAYEANSPFTVWWADIVRFSTEGSKDAAYTMCVESLDGALYDTIYSLYDVYPRAPRALAGLMRAMELWRGCDARVVPDDLKTLDLRDISQMLYICLFQFDLYIGPDSELENRRKWEGALNSWFEIRCQYVRTATILATLPVEEARERVEYEDDYYFDSLDEITWVINMLEWYKLDDPRRDLGVNLLAWQRQVAEYESELRPQLRHLRQAGLAAPDKWAPRRFWWRSE